MSYQDFAGSGTQYNFMDPAIYDNPFTLYQQLRENDPVFWTDLIDADGWLLTRYEDCKRVLKERATFGPGPRTRELFEAQFPEAKNNPEKIDFLVEISLKAMFVADPPYHTALRTVGNQAFFRPQILARYRETLQHKIECLVDKLPKHHQMDLHADFAAQIPFAMIDFFDFPDADREQLIFWIEESVLLFAGLIEDVDTLYRVDVSMREFIDYVEKQVEIRREKPGKNVISYMLERTEKKQLGNRDLAMICVTIFGAGHVTVVDNVTGGIEAFIRHPDQIKLLMQQPELMDNAVEEALRYVTPQQIINRRVMNDIVIADQLIPKDHMVFAVLGAANRDPEVFPDPERFDITRDNAKKHLASGSGPHHCLGATLSRMEMEIAFRELFTRIPDIRLSGKLQWRKNSFFRGLLRLPVAW